MRRKGLYALLLSTPILYACSSVKVGGYTIDRETQIEIAELGYRVDVNKNNIIESWEIERVKQQITFAENIHKFINNMQRPFRRKEENE